MTNCTSKPIAFSPVSRKKIEANFSGGAITSNAGILLLKEVMNKVQLRDRLKSCFTDPRDPSKVKHKRACCKLD